MTADPLRRALRALLPRSGSASASPALVVQHLGLAGSDLDTLPAVLDEVGRQLGVELTLDGVRGDVVLAEQGFVARVAPQVLQAFLDERPLVTVPAALDDSDTRRRGRQLHGELLRQLSAPAAAATAHAMATAAGLAPAAAELSLPTALAAGYRFDSQFDSRQHADHLAAVELDPDRAELLNRLRSGLADATQPMLLAGYGRRSVLALDFSSGTAYLDDLADQQLRLRRELPYLAQGARPPAPGCRQRALPLVAWDIALAAGDFRLLHSPLNWWHTPLLAAPGFNVARYSVQPQHLEMARVLAAEPLSPAALRRRCRVGLVELRGFLQAGLFLGLLRWAPAAAAH